MSSAFSDDYMVYTGLEPGMCLFLHVFLKPSVKKSFLKYKYRDKGTVEKVFLSNWLPFLKQYLRISNFS